MASDGKAWRFSWFFDQAGSVVYAIFMHDQQWQDLKQVIAEMNDAEKLELIERLAHSLRSTKNGAPRADAVEGQHQAFRQLQEKLATLPPTKDPHAQLGYSNEAHDKILYDLGQK